MLFLSKCIYKAYVDTHTQSHKYTLIYKQGFLYVIELIPANPSHKQQQTTNKQTNKKPKKYLKHILLPLERKYKLDFFLEKTYSYWQPNPFVGAKPLANYTVIQICVVVVVIIF